MQHAAARLLGTTLGGRYRIRSILEKSGWAAIQIRPIDVPCVLPEKELIPYFTRLGSLGRILQAADEQRRPNIIATVRAAFDPYVHGDEVRFSAACWRVSARSTG